MVATERRITVARRLFKECEVWIHSNSSYIAKDDWPTYGASIDDYEKDFKPLLENGHIRDFIKNRSSPVVIDLMSPSDALASLFKKIPDKPKFGLAITLVDKRDIDQKQRDEKLGIKELAGNLLVGKTWARIRRELEGRKADLIIERAVLGWEFLPKDNNLYVILLDRAWRLLSEENGVLLVQAPREEEPSIASHIRFNKVIELLNINGVGTTYCSVDKGYGGWALKIVKKENSPKRLPFFQ